MSKEKLDKKLEDFIAAEEKILEAKVVGIRTISHSTEKGRAAEYEVMQLLRSLLPAEYGLSTGFIVYHSNDSICKVSLSSQLDIIIYDALRCGPIIRLGACEVFPLEAVYGYVEVKLSLSDIPDKKTKVTPIQKCIRQSNELRTMKTRLYWVPVEGTNTKTKLTPIPPEDVVPIRSYVFVLDADSSLKDAMKIKEIAENESKKIGGDSFISGMYIWGVGFFESHSCESEGDPKNFSIDYKEENGLLRFKWSILHGLSRYPRVPKHYTPAIDSYFGDKLVSQSEKPAASSATTTAFCF